jgi:tellurite resistance protein
MNKEIEIINKIIVEAIQHGADAGGSYDSNEKNLITAVEEWLELKDFGYEYAVKKNVEVMTKYRTTLNAPQIVSLVDEDLRQRWREELENWLKDL